MSDIISYRNLFFYFRNDTDTWCCARFGQGTGPILLDDVGCLGTEYDIGQCPHRGWGMHNCRHYEDVSIRCSPKGNILNKNIQMEFFEN